MKIVYPGNYSGMIDIPPSKSDSQRAILAAGLSEGVSQLQNAGKSQDELVMLRFIQEIGAQVREIEPGKLEIIGTKKFPSKASFSGGESGLSTRLMIAICAAHQGQFTIDGEGSLLKRPMDFYENQLPQMGVEVKSNAGFLPLHLQGPIRAGAFRVDGSQGSQYVSGLLMALPLLKANSILEVENLVSRPYIDMTVNCLKHFGIKIEHRQFSYFSIEGSQQYKACDYQIEGDWSSASCWLVASALGANLSVSGLNPVSLQADWFILKAFEAANCQVIWSDNVLKIDGHARKNFVFDATNCPDLFPALTTLAALTEGTSVIYGVKRLAGKESNRGLALQSEFGKLGIKIHLLGDEMHIEGQAKIDGGMVQSHNDHRIAMCLAIAGMFATQAVEIEEELAVNKSYPDFWKDFDGLLVNR